MLKFSSASRPKRPAPAPLSQPYLLPGNFFACKPEGCRVHLQQRNNTGMMLIVEQGIVEDTLHGSVQAWRFLAANDVPEDVILRVLSDPAKRRACGPVHVHMR